MAQPDTDLLPSEIEDDELDARIESLSRQLLVESPAANLLGFEPWPMQRKFFNDDHMVCFVTSGNQAGKDYILCTRLAIAVTRIEPLSLEGSLAFVPEPPIRCRYYVPVNQTWEKVILPVLLQMIPVDFRNTSRSADGSGYNQKDSTLHLADGGWVQGCTYTGHRQDESRSQSVRLNIACLSEVPPQDLFDQLTGARTILAPGAKIWGAMTMDARLSKYPMGWVRQRIIMSKDPNVTRLKISTRENVYGMARLEEAAGRPDRAKQLIEGLEAKCKLLSPQDYASQIEGEWAGMQGIVYNELDEHANAYMDGEDVDPQIFVTLRDKEYGIIEAGMDYGKAAPTAIEYYFLCRHAVEELDMVEGDIIQFAEYYRAGARVPAHLPAVAEIHSQLNPSVYFFDPHMADKPDSGPSVIEQYAQGMREACGFTGFVPGDNSKGAVDAGVELVAALLAARDGAFPWPRLRVVVPRCPNGWESYLCWAFKQHAEFLPSGEKYEEEYKHSNDCSRYFALHHPELKPREVEKRREMPPIWLLDGRSRAGRPAMAATSRRAEQMNSIVSAYRALG